MSTDGHKLIIRAKKPGESEEVDESVTLQFNELKLFGHGVYSNVYTGVVNENGKERTVAIKKCWGYESDAKEIRILRRLNRYKAKNIVKLLYVFSKNYGDKVCLSLVMAFMPMTLSSHIRANKPKPLDVIEAKLFAWQMFRGLNWMHKNEVFHRDLKPQNILINPQTYLLQIADFGSSVIMGEFDSFSSYHVTRYYRPPELLLEAHKYGPSIDVWSAGCVFAEMLRGHIFLPGSTTENQLEKILNCFGAPTERQLSAMHACCPKLLEKSNMVKAIKSFNARGQNGLESLMPYAPAQALTLLESIFAYAPLERLHGPKLLADPFFEEIFDSKLERNGKPLNLLTKKDYTKAVSGDTPLGFKIGSSESNTRGSTEKTLEKTKEK